jgi:hypothetical protein
MTAPTATLTITQRHRLKDLKWEESMAVPPGRVMLCKGRRVVGYCNVADLGNSLSIAERANTVCLSPADAKDVKAWLG